MSSQADLFDLPDDAPADRPPVAAPTRKRGKTRPARPHLVAEILEAIHHGGLGMLDDADRVVVFEEHDRVRLSADEDAVLHLLTQRYVERRPARDTVSCLHGIARKPVTPLRLTRSGHSLRNRWTSLKPLP